MCEALLHAQCLEVASAAAASYLQDLSGRFATELWEYVASGLSIQAYDRAVFGRGPEARKQHESKEAMNSAGRPAAYLLLLQAVPCVHPIELNNAVQSMSCFI